MKLQRIMFFILLAFFAGIFLSSCSNGDNSSTKLASKPGSEQKDQLEKGKEKILSNISGEVSFGIFFNKEGTSRTITLKNDQKEFKGYIIVNFPEEMGINAVQWKLLSEAFPCVNGPSLLIHTLTLLADEGLKNAVISIIPDKHGDFLGISKCDGQVEVRAASYKGVVNPED